MPLVCIVINRGALPKPTPPRSTNEAAGVAPDRMMSALAVAIGSRSNAADAKRSLRILRSCDWGKVESVRSLVVSYGPSGMDDPPLCLLVPFSSETVTRVCRDFLDAPPFPQAL